MTRQCFFPGVKDLPQENTQPADESDGAVWVVTDAAAGPAARIVAGVAASIPPAMSAIGVMIASERCRVGLSPRWLARKTRSSRSNEQYLCPYGYFRSFLGTIEPGVCLDG